jgi:hypothetical protein
MPLQAHPHAHIESTVETGQGGIKTAYLSQRGGVNQHSCLPYGKHIAEAVVLGLI